MISNLKIEKLAREYCKPALRKYDLEHHQTIWMRQDFTAGFQKCLELLNAHEKTRIKDILENAKLQERLKIAIYWLNRIDSVGCKTDSLMASEALKAIGESFILDSEKGEL